VHHQNAGSARLRHTATGALAALAALAVVGAIAGTTALAAKPHHKRHHHATVANSSAKTPTSPAPSKSNAPPQDASQQPFFDAIKQLVDNGTISAAQGQAVDSQIQRGYFDSSTLAGFTQAQIQAVEQAISNTKRAMGPAEPPAAGKGGTPPQGAKTPSS
jgi:hypothetical protein